MRVMSVKTKELSENATKEKNQCIRSKKREITLAVTGTIENGQSLTNNEVVDLGKLDITFRHKYKRLLCVKNYFYDSETRLIYEAVIIATHVIKVMLNCVYNVVELSDVVVNAQGNMWNFLFSGQQHIFKVTSTFTSTGNNELLILILHV